MPLEVILMFPVVYFEKQPTIHPPDEFDTGFHSPPLTSKHLIPIPGLPAGARLVTAWWIAIDAIDQLKLFRFIDVDVSAPSDVMLDARLNDEETETRIRLKVYVLYEI